MTEPTPSATPPQPEPAPPPAPQIVITFSDPPDVNIDPRLTVFAIAGAAMLLDERARFVARNALIAAFQADQEHAARNTIARPGRGFPRPMR